MRRVLCIELIWSLKTQPNKVLFLLTVLTFRRQPQKRRHYGHYILVIWSLYLNILLAISVTVISLDFSFLPCTRCKKHERIFWKIIESFVKGKPVKRGR